MHDHLAFYHTGRMELTALTLTKVKLFLTKVDMALYLTILLYSGDAAAFQGPLPDLCTELSSVHTVADVGYEVPEGIRLISHDHEVE